MPEMKLTERRIRELQAPSNKGYERYWDSEVKGLCVKVTQAGRKRYLFKGSLPGQSSPIWHSGPSCADYNLEDMRDDVREWKVHLRKGVNPFEQKESLVPTVHELCVENLKLKETQVNPKLSESYLKSISLYTKWIEKSSIANIPVDRMTTVDADIFLGNYTGRNAEYLRSWLMNCYNLAIRRAYVPLGFNPWLYTERKHSPPDPALLPRFTDDEIAKIADYLRKAELGQLKRSVNPIWTKFIWFLIRNGTRPNDTRIIERSWLRERDGIHYILHPKTKTGEKRMVLSEASFRDVEELMKLKGSDYLFPGVKCRHLKNYRKEFLYLRDVIGVDKPPYAIRRWFAWAGRKVYNGDIAPVQRLVGWETEEMALRYSGDDESFMEKFIFDNAEICRSVSARVEEVVHA